MQLASSAFTPPASHALKTRFAPPVNHVAPQFGMLPILLPNQDAQAINYAAKGILPRLSNGLTKSSGRLVDTLFLLTVANLVPVIGHLTLWPLAAASGGLAVKDFLQGARVGGKLLAQTKERFPKLVNVLKATEKPFNDAAAGAHRWVSKIMPAVWGGLGLFLAGIIFHPLIVVGGPLLLLHPLAYTGGYLKNLAVAGAKLISKQA